MRFPPSFLDEIRDRIPISDVIGRRVTWDRRKTQPGRGDYWACCPFHGEKSPSFHCEDQKGRYHCFGCGVSGDHFRFLTELEGLAFPEAVERLAAEAGLAMPDRDPEAERREAQRSTILDAMREASTFFQTVLHQPDGAKARAYLRDRGLDPRTQATFGLGYAPDSRNRLKEHLAGKGIGKDQIEGAGLVVHGEGIAVSYDRFRDRIMFPIQDLHDKVIAFGGRAMSKEAQAKYLNSPETEVFHKGQVLFNLARARRAAKAAGTLIVVEGYMDAIMLAQAGFEHAVAPLGTALTERQLDLVWRTTGEPVLCFDGDAAGLKAAHRAAELALPLLKPGRSLRFALMPEGKDPDDIVRSEGAEAFADILAAARPLADLVWMRETQGGVFDTPERRADLEHRLKALFRQIGDETVRRHYQDDAAERLRGFFGAAPAGGRDQRGRRGEERRPGPRRPGAAGGRRSAISQQLARSSLAMRPRAAEPSLREITIVLGFINHPSLLEEEFEAFTDLDLPPGDLARLRSSVLDAYAEHLPSDREALLDDLSRRGTRGLFDVFEAKARAVRLWPVLAEAAPEDAREAVRQALRLHHRYRSLNRELIQAEEALGREQSEAAYAHMIEVKREIERIEGMEALIDGFGVLSGRPAKAI
ncbi:DNA primase [Aurantimonas sp. VKM B-3413]|uniref:DNA primase n=1 Tax=Aurantimonas sp. VKM B-3413 TaxID=2779401 RepID=UPI001E2859DE|nr:DNA primase [Aurantimonas sp. VKM B-3413]MCB8838619.1 DNA primase [Aurantimonas sp. VKM B-3413]